MKKLITIALVCLSAAAVAAAPSLAANSNGPAKKANGDIWFMNNYGPEIGQVPAHWIFNAQEGASAKGSVYYEDMFGSYTAKVTSVKVDSAKAATFSATVTSGTYKYATVGQTFTWTVHDLGEPGTQDFFTYLPEGGGSTDLPAITAGNIQVHS